MTDRKRLVFFDKWADPIAEEILGAIPSIELVRLSTDMPRKEIWNAFETGHGYQWPVPPYLGDRALVSRCPKLLAISSQGSGCDRMDFEACNEAGVMIVNQAGLGGREAVATHAFAMMIALSKQLIQSDRAMRRDRGWERLEFTGDDLTEKTVGIIGFGNIGGRLGEMCHSTFDMKVLAYDPYLDATEIEARGARKVELDELLAEADFVSINCPLTSETNGMIGAREIARMKPSAYFVSTARGGIHDETALAEALSARRIRGAGLDVFEEEPPSLNHPLLTFDNVVVSPHIAGVTHQAYRVNARAAAEQWIDIFAGKRPPRLVNAEVWPRYQDRYRSVFGEETVDA